MRARQVWLSEVPGDDLLELALADLRLDTALELARRRSGRGAGVPREGDERSVGPLRLRLVDDALPVRLVLTAEHHVAAPQARVLAGDVADLLRVLTGCRGRFLVVLARDDRRPGDRPQVVDDRLLVARREGVRGGGGRDEGRHEQGRETRRERREGASRGAPAGDRRRAGCRFGSVPGSELGGDEVSHASSASLREWCLTSGHGSTEPM